MANAQRKLSKRKGDPSFEDLLNQGYLTEAIINYLVLLGWSPRGEREFYTLKELEQVFDLEGLSKSPSIFDTVKLNWFNAEYIRKLTPEDYLERATPWLNQVLDPQKFDYRRLGELLQSRTEVFNQLPEMVGFLAELPESARSCTSTRSKRARSNRRSGRSNWFGPCSSPFRTGPRPSCTTA